MVSHPMFLGPFDLNPFVFSFFCFQGNLSPPDILIFVFSLFYQGAQTQMAWSIIGNHCLSDPNHPTDAQQPWEKKVILFWLVDFKGSGTLPKTKLKEGAESTGQL